jgi:hypothetical protein
VIMVAQLLAGQHHPARVKPVFHCFAPLSVDCALESARDPQLTAGSAFCRRCSLIGKMRKKAITK